MMLWWVEMMRFRSLRAGIALQARRKRCITVMPQGTRADGAPDCQRELGRVKSGNILAACACSGSVHVTAGEVGRQARDAIAVVLVGEQLFAQQLCGVRDGGESVLRPERIAAIDVQDHWLKECERRVSASVSTRRKSKRVSGKAELSGEND